jgi:Aspartyl protease
MRTHFSMARFAPALFCAVVCASLLSPQTPTHPPDKNSPLDAELTDFRLIELEAQLKTMPPGAERDYFAGVLANRAGKNEDSIGLLENALPGIRTSQLARAAIALEALADDYTKNFRYADAARAYDDLLTHFAIELPRKKVEGTKNDAAVVHILREAPPQTISWQGPVRLQTHRNPLSSLNTELTVNGVKQQWLLDTGANMSAVSKSFAQRLGLKPLPGSAQTMAGITGIENALQVAVLPTLEIGGAILHDVVILILDDSNLKVGTGKMFYQINAILGYPVFQALGAITFTHDGWFEAGDAARSNDAGTRMYMKLLAPVIECGVEGTDYPFTFDSGASGTNLSVRYFERFHGELKSWKSGENKSFGAGGMVTRKIYMQPRLTLAIGDRAATLHRVPIFTEPMGTDLDDVYGNLGQDLVANAESFTLDFSKMTFSLGAPLANQTAH